MDFKSKTERSFQGVTVLVTRPVAQAERLCRLLENQGAGVVRFPVIEIVEARDTASARKLIDQLDAYDIAIFTSANAVKWGMAFIQDQHRRPTYPIITAIGRASAQALERFGVSPRLVPEKAFTSEAILAMPRMQRVSGQRIIIFRGEGGRGVLGDTLRARGARVDYAEVYRRVKPALNPSPLIRCLQRGEIDVAVVTSNESLQNLFDIVGEIGQQWLRTMPFVVVSRRALRLAQALGVTHPALLAREVSDEAIVEALLTWHQARFESLLGTRNDG